MGSVKGTTMAKPSASVIRGEGKAAMVQGPDGVWYNVRELVRAKLANPACAPERGEQIEGLLRRARGR
jgi:hypothetical protein